MNHQYQPVNLAEDLYLFSTLSYPTPSTSSWRRTSLYIYAFFITVFSVAMIAKNRDMYWNLEQAYKHQLDLREQELFDKFSTPNATDTLMTAVRHERDVLKETIKDVIGPLLVQAHTDNAEDWAGKGQEIRLFGEAYRARRKLASVRAKSDIKLSVRDEAWGSLVADREAQVIPWITGGKYKSLEALQASWTRPRGIVITSGVINYRWLLHLVAGLRRVHQTTLPIEIIYAGEPDLPTAHRQALEALAPDVRCIDILDVFDETIAGLPGKWAIKPFAMLASSFKEAILLDADAVMLQTPDLMFEEDGYKETGALYYHDRQLHFQQTAKTNWIKAKLEQAHASQFVLDSKYVQGETSDEMESGAVVMDKDRALIGLLAITWLNTQLVRDTVTYTKSYGEKESWWYGMAITDTKFAWAGGYAGGIGVRNPDDPSRICTTHIVHILAKDHTPLWFNDALVHDKDDNDDQYEVCEAWSDEGYWDTDFWPNSCFVSSTKGGATLITQK
ncbi:hypothetical protein BZG36_02066 [Bifiguratus adelaidae]|uniref:Glycosyltransferase family 71 protein n=1 Tax=Bifiguratus adelaidae TaxID=1938954 RepID=A0A261Y235_9FUNG|nr:hypothetical protein BZG36_02066 [Bifiguratus adelaidae]